jgi:hypothetical protein
VRDSGLDLGRFVSSLLCCSLLSRSFLGRSLLGRGLFGRRLLGRGFWFLGLHIAHKALTLSLAANAVSLRLDDA